MNISIVRMIFAFALVLILTATGLWAGGEDEAPAATADKEMVTDPTTGEMVTAPEYGGTLTIGKRLGIGSDTDPYFGWGGLHVQLVSEKLGIGDWGIDRDEWDFRSGPIPVSVITGRLAERWDISPDGLTYTFHIRNGVLWHNKAPMNGRELTAHDIEFNFHRILGMGEFTEAGPSAFNAAGPLTSIPFESITATDDSTVVMKLNEVHLPALRLILEEYFTFIMPPEVIREHGDVKDWKNLVGTGPFELTALDEDSSFTLTKNPDYWGYDEKYPENRLPYVDEIRVLNFADQRQTNPEIVQHTVPFRSNDAFAANVRVPPFDDIGVRKAMQMALDLETVANTYHKGQADPTPQGLVGVKGYFIPFDQWPEEVKQGYRYDPEGAEKLLDEAGYPRGADGTRFKTILNYGPWADLGYVEIAVAYWAEIGVDIEIDVLDYGEYHERLFSRTYEGMVSAISGTIYDPEMTVSWYHSDNQWNRGGSQWAQLDALVDAALAATTIEEQQRLVREADMYAMANHWLIWSPKLPFFVAFQPWVIGYNGEVELAKGETYTIFSRLWIDSRLKEEMGR